MSQAKPIPPTRGEGDAEVGHGGIATTHRAHRGITAAILSPTRFAEGRNPIRSVES